MKRKNIQCFTNLEPYPKRIKYNENNNKKQHDYLKEYFFLYH